MSFESWKKEFYPVDAREEFYDEKPTREKTRSAILHSIRKWEGLTETNLNLHEATRDSFLIWFENDSISFEVGPRTCALCCLFDSDCNRCRLYCTFGHCEKISPYQEFQDSGNVEPMLNILRAMLKRYEDKYDVDAK